MYFVIENTEQLDRLETSDEAFVQLVPSNDNYHPILTRPSLVYYNNHKKGYVFVINHSEGFSLDIKRVEEFLSSHKKIYLLDKKFHSYFLDLPQSIDLQFTCLDSTNDYKEFACETPVHRNFYSKYSTMPNLNEIIPIAKHYEKCQCLYDMVKVYFDLEMDTQMQDKFVKAYKEVEENGIRIDVDCFHKKFEFNHEGYSLSGTTVYSYYNLYNLTGRPTNSFNGLNFLAIPKEGKHRKCFVPKNDFLVEFDFDSYHLRLIAKLVAFELPKTSIHRYLGEIYFGTKDLTEEQYKQSKEITFKQIYGGVEPQYSHVEFFSSMSKYIERQWQFYKEQGALTLPTGRILRRTHGMNKLKLFNYIIQNLETKENIEKILRVNALLSEKDTKLILITYDSFLFDFSQLDGKQLLKEVKSILEDGDTPVSLKYGSDYSFEQN